MAKLKLSDQGEPIFSSADLITEVYRGNLDKLYLAKADPDDREYQSYIQFLDKNTLDDWPLPEPFIVSDTNIKQFDQNNQNNWFMPREYAEFDILGYIYSLCRTEEETDRVLKELELFVKHDMIDVLRFLKYLVDTMRENKVLWGVGRGSSVASYCLYLLGVHKIDSLKYDLDIREFLK